MNRHSYKYIFFWIVSILTAFLFLLPLLWMLHASFRPEARIFQGGIRSLFSFHDLSCVNYLQAWQRAQLGMGLFNSFLQVSGIIVGGLFVNSLAAYAFARMRFPGRNVLFAIVLMFIILPIEVLVVPLFLTMRDIHLMGAYKATMAALILPFTAKAFNIYFLRQHFLLLPTDLEEAAVMDGAGPFTIFWRIALPAIRPALVTVIVLDVLTHWSDFIWPLIVCTREETRTVQISLANLFTQPPVQWGDILACAVIATIPVLLLFRYAQHHIIISDMGSGLK
jgi:ABC-type glycerol-3-phosphate transport system permease component